MHTTFQQFHKCIPLAVARGIQLYQTTYNKRQYINYEDKVVIYQFMYLDNALQNITRPCELFSVNIVHWTKGNMSSQLFQTMSSRMDKNITER